MNRVNVAGFVINYTIETESTLVCCGVRLGNMIERMTNMHLKDHDGYWGIYLIKQPVTETLAVIL